jgi:hypothetical protein
MCTPTLDQVNTQSHIHFINFQRVTALEAPLTLSRLIMVAKKVLELEKNSLRNRLPAA